jgi:prepilin-type N-terminal cleavage/methylation domain-containing protein
MEEQQRGMDPTMILREIQNRRPYKQRGFTLIETMIAMVVLSVGILSLAAMLADSLAYMNTSQYDYIAQQKAAESIESIYTARNLGQATWSTICNVGSSVCTGGIFMNGAEPLCDPGADEIIGTADDYSGTNCSVSPDSVLMTDSTGKYPTSMTSTAKIPLTAYNFKRTITITAFPNVTNLRTITVLITYQAGRFNKSYTLTANISNFS